MKNPFKRKKANRFKGYSPSKEELQEEFEKLLKHRIGERIQLEMGERPGLQKFLDFRMEHGNRISDEERAKLVREMKSRGYSRAIEFDRQPGQDLLLKKIIGGKHE